MSASKPSSKGHAPAPDRTKRPNTVGLDQRRLAEVLDLFDAASPCSAVQRDFRRYPFRHTSLKLEIAPPSGPLVTISVASRNISRGGMGIMHCAYMHPGTECIVHLPRAGGELLRVQASVVRCSHRTGVLHEIGLSFDAPVDLKDLLCPDPFAECFSLERIQPAKLIGTLVHADASDADHAVLRHFLRETTLAIRNPKCVDSAVKSAHGADLVIADYNLQDGTADQVLAAMRRAGNPAPVIITTASTDPGARALIAASDADAFLVKPIKQDALFRALGEIMLLGKETSTTGEGAEASPAVIAKFVRELKRHAASLENAARCGDAAAVREVCRQIAKAAPRAGMHTLARAATDPVPDSGKFNPECLFALRAEIAKQLLVKDAA